MAVSSDCPSVCPVPDPKSRMQGHTKLKIGSKEAHETGDCDPIHRSKGQRLRPPGRLILRGKMRHIFRRGRPTNLKLGTGMEDNLLWHPARKRNGSILTTPEPTRGWWRWGRFIYTVHYHIFACNNVSEMLQFFVIHMFIRTHGMTWPVFCIKLVGV